MPDYALKLTLPAWLEQTLPDSETVYPTVETRMDFVIQLASANVANGTGGPFGAGLFESESGRLIAPGINMVLSANCCILHAEVTAIIIAQTRLGCYDLGEIGMPHIELVSSTEPCAMCMGAILWSGVRHLVCGARDEDAREIGFDEGPKLKTWIREFELRGIQVTRDVRREEAREVLSEYQRGGGVIYNSRSGG
jgi:tRNA(Arg) A34 adenosine deaminase TadA